MDCQVCLETFNNLERRAMVLECGHTFCKSCISILYLKIPVICPLDRIGISKPLTELKVNYSLDEIIRSMSSIRISDPNQAPKIIDSSAKPELNQKSHSNNSEIQSNITVKSQQIMCPRRHILSFFCNIQDRNRTANKSIAITVICDECKTYNIRSSWSCIGCNYDLCEPCSKLSQQVSSASSILNQPQLLCTNKHQLEHYTLVENRNRAAGLHLQSAIRCDFCNTSNLRSSWSCIRCNFDICEQCIDEQVNSESSLGLPNQNCPNSHPLNYYQSTNNFYRRKISNFSFIKCNLCSDKWNGGSWACRLCNFDLCDKCVHRSNEIANVKCNNNHALRILFNQAQRRDCGICKVLSDCLYACSNCNFYSCEDCIRYYRRVNFLPFTCFKGHNVAYSDDQILLYERRNGHKTFRCNGCKNLFPNVMSYHCRRCDFDLCNSCFEVINKGISKGISRRCTRGHELRWCSDTCEFYRNPYNCDLCSENYNRLGSFHCRECKFDLCVKCSKSLIKK